MKNIMNGLGYILIALGIMAMAGSGGDCDGKCMELANPMWLMLLIGFGSIVSLGLGAIMINQTGRIQ